MNPNDCTGCKYEGLFRLQSPCNTCGSYLPFDRWTPADARAPKDMVNHPPHYTAGGIECIDAIKAALTEEEFRGYCKGNALKYIWREKHKGGEESMKKAVWYLNKLTENSDV